MKSRILLLIFTFTVLHSFAQQKNEKIKIFYDCHASCFQTYVKQNLSEVEFVRDRKFADVHILILSERNASGGRTYHLEFYGQHQYKDIQKKLSFPTSTDSTEEKVREKLMKYLKIGLLDFWVQNGVTDKLNIELQTKGNNKDEKDKWNHWLFKVGANGWFNGSSNVKSSSINGFVSASQIKENNKFSLRIRYYSGNDTYKYGESEIKSTKESFSTSIYDVISINDHWSYGFFGNIYRSKFQNYNISTDVFAGLEYNIFPYKESSKRSLVFTAKIGTTYNKYFEKTIYNKQQEQLYRSKFFLTGDVVKKWGSLYANINYNTYLHNLKLNSMGFGAGCSLRVAKGLNFNLYSHYTINHDQINIAGGDLSLEETLLRQKELQSGYNYYFSVGFDYSFGSIYSSIVNPRFNADNGQSRTCICF